MRHINYTLTPAKLNAAKGKDAPYKLADGGGLFVRVSAAGTRTWCYGYSFANKRKEVTFGQFPEVGVKEARDRHLAARQQLAAGIDPAASKKEEKAAQLRAAESDEYVFKTFVAKFIEECLGNTSDYYKRQFKGRMALHVHPHIGAKRLEEIKPRDILAIIEALRATPATADKCRGNIKQIFDHAIRKLIVETNPADAMKGVVKVPPNKHHRHLNESELGVFWRSLGTVSAGTDPSTIACARLIALSLCRKNEAAKARWADIDLERGTWTIPASGMKMRRAHRVFLPTQAVAILEEQKALTGGEEFVFSAFSRRKHPLCLATVTKCFKRLEGVPSDFTPHGLRGTGATILREHGFRRDVVELLLAHVEKGVAGAYHHHELADERRAALQHYADTIEALAAGAKVVGLQARAAKAA